MATLTTPRKWSVEDSLDLYNIRQWGNRYFSANEKGRLTVQPGGPGSDALDLWELVGARFNIATVGRPSHAGAQLSRGRSAIREMARRILQIEEMTSEDVVNPPEDFRMPPMLKWVAAS